MGEALVVLASAGNEGRPRRNGGVSEGEVVDDGSLREAVDKVGGELITIVHKTGKENSGTAA